MRALVLLAVTGCSGSVPPPALVASGARLPAPLAIDPSVRGASYLTQVAAQLQPRWSDFLEDCRLRLPANHPLNARTLAATFDLAIGKTGAIVGRTEVATSGNGDFDTAAADVLADASPLPEPPSELASDDELVHLRWQFARDRRQAGAATASIQTLELPVLAATERMLARGELARAARRVAGTPVATPESTAAVHQVMIAALREALDSPDGAARRAAVEAVGRAELHELATEVRGQLAAPDPGLRLAAIDAAGALGDRAAAAALVLGLRDDLVAHAQLGLARVAALSATGHADAAASALRAVLELGPNPTALAALRVVPIPALAGKLTGWSTSRTAAVRSAVCAALPGAAPASAAALIARGLRDGDAMVRATCADAAARDQAGSTPAILRRLRELARDRDHWVRARAVAALGQLDPAAPVRAAGDPAPEVRAAYAASATEPELRALLADRAPEVRAAGLDALGSRAAAAEPAAIADAVLAAAADPSSVVRLAAIAALRDPEPLARLARDDSPDVASAALVRWASVIGRTGSTSQLLDQLAAAPAGGMERVRIALAWLLAR
jgi:hypothetical protein